MDISKLQKGDKVVCEIEVEQLSKNNIHFYTSRGEIVNLTSITKIIPKPVEFKTGLKIINRVGDIVQVIGVLDDRVYVKYNDHSNLVAFTMDACQKFTTDGTWKVLDQ